jgi:hypothetical protein
MHLVPTSTVVEKDEPSIVRHQRDVVDIVERR